MGNELEIYIHIPFCVRKCLYCDFVSFAGKEELFDTYVTALCEEMRRVSPEYANRKIRSVYIGGGTPSVLRVEQFLRMTEALYKYFPLDGTFGRRKGFHLQKKVRPETEFSVECNPGTVDRQKLRAYRKAGVNRLSIGLQSTNEEDLRMLGRIHTYGDFERTFEDARETEFDNINIDLMQAIPGQTLDGWKRVMAVAGMWKPEHISAYSLIVEEGTPFETLQKEGKLSLADEEEEREIYHYTKAFLEMTGYHRYEISNYSLPGYECRHNIGYWRRENYLGLGLHASSLVDNRRWKNTADLNLYLNAFAKGTMTDPNRVREENEELSHKEQMDEYLFLGLRLTDGISKEEFLNTFHQDFDFTYAQKIRKFVDMHLMEEKNGRVCLTERGIDISNWVLSQLLLD